MSKPFVYELDGYRTDVGSIQEWHCNNALCKGTCDCKKCMFYGGNKEEFKVWLYGQLNVTDAMQWRKMDNNPLKGNNNE